jgi:ferric-dicitrate binding protein FerR (iron transport regulator)
MTTGESGSPTLSDVEAVVRENVSGHVDGDRHEQGKQRLLSALRERKRSGTGSRQRWLLAGAGVVALAGLVGLAWKRHASPRIAYQVSGGLVSDSGYVRGTGSSGARLTFTDGTRIDLQDGARARIASADAHGARIAIENGHAALNVARAPTGMWFVDAGPFVIQVTGTQFDVDWSSYDDTLAVDLHEGSLTVSGPPAPAGVLLRAGQRLTAHEGRLSIEALESAVQVAETPPAAEPAPFPPSELSPEEAARLFESEAPLPAPAAAASF